MYRRFFVVFFSLLAFCLSFPRVAYAAYSPTVVWSGYYDDGDSFGSVVKAGGTFDAAAVSLGYDPARISANDKSKLADPDYGGRFYLYSQTFVRVNTPLDFPDWVPGYIVMGSTISSAWDSLTNQFVRLWVSGVSSSLYEGALADLRAVLAGEDLGGGGSGTVVPVGDYYSIPVSAQADSEPASTSNKDSYRHTAQNATYSNGNLVLGSGTTKYSSWVNNSAYVSSGVVYATHELLSLADTYINQGYQVCFVTNFAYVFLVYGNNLSVQYGKHGSWYNYALVGSNMRRMSVRTTAYYDSTNGLFTFVPDDSFGAAVSTTSPFRIDYLSQVFTSPFDVSTPPSGTWPEPETPATPTAPELPDPVTPTVTPEPTFTEPTPTWPVIPTPTAPTVTLTDTPSGLDYTQLLTLINDNLNDINSYTVAINSNFNSLRSDLVTEFDSVVQALRNIYQYLQHMDNVLERHCVHLQNKMEDVSVDIQNKMRELVHWLADELDFDSSVDGDDELSDILSTINGKLGGGTYEPNPISNEDGYYEWLDDLWDRFLLGDDWESSVSGISSSFGQLKTRFPFSVPWDIVALFRLFVHDPVTPEFDLPLYFSSDSSTPVHVDLSAWDDVASIVRPLVYVIFALKLALLSRDLLGGLGADKGGLL